MLLVDLKNQDLKIEGRFCFVELAILIKKMSLILDAENEKSINETTVFNTAMKAFEDAELDINELIEKDIKAKSKSSISTSSYKKVCFEVDADG